MRDRPPVLAHRRFVADRAAFAELDLRQRFERIHTTNLWGAATTTAGLGSETAATAALRIEVPALLQRLGVTTLLDAPCGAAPWIDAGVPTIGIDIVPAVVAARAAGGGDFRVGDITVDPLPAADAILCRDCLVHLSFENISRAVTNFRASGARYLLTTTFTEWPANHDCDDGDWRALNFMHAPFGWPAPIELLDERCDEGAGGWRDKSLGVWRLADIGKFLTSDC